ncbi:MAG: DUF1015 domain-containing protein [Verrucomicrobiaceae bacterium]|nr:DUF1015 domain-containing protein [Verrucomicrobiaceae bacterium]
MRVKAFPALVPAPDLAATLASVPYDVINTAEARALAEGLPHSFLRVERAELELPADTDPYSEEVYSHAKANFEKMQRDGVFVREPEPCLYFYRQIMDGRAQIGITLACHIEDYENDLIKKHEKTRKVKEDDRTRLTDVLSANTGPVFLTYKDVAAIDTFIADWIASHEPTSDFVDDVAVRHTVWRVTADAAAPVLSALGDVPYSYVADGHHRSASAARVGKERREANPDHDGSEDYNWFLAVMFPASQLNILPYNRVVRDLNGLSADGFLQRLADSFHLDSNGQKTPAHAESACLYLDGRWHTLSWDAVSSANPIDRLDVSFLQDHVLTPLLAIGDPRTDDRIDFIGGIRGTDELEKRVDSGDWAVAFSLFPTTVQQLIDIADAGEIMPPKSTWFEPKLRSGLFVHTLD